jgi:hypothetical protein
MLDWLKIPVDFKTRLIDVSSLETTIVERKRRKYFIVVSNMGTTMFGAVDNPDNWLHTGSRKTSVKKYNKTPAY